MIFYGTRSKHIISKKAPGTCASCEKNDLYFTVYATYAHIMWIPFFPFGKNIYSYCGHCQNQLELREMSQDLRLKAKDIKSQTSYPKWYYSGIVLATFLIAGSVFVERNQKQQIPEYIKAPQVNDIYYIEEKFNEYSSFKVERLDSDSLYVYWNNFYVKKSYDIKDIDISKNYDTKAWGISRTFIDSVYEIGKIVKIKR